jgi:hypothetical protein
MRPRLLTRDPTFLAILFAFLALLSISPPWTVRWREFSPEEVWIRLTLAATLTTICFRPRSRPAWSALVLAVIWNLPGYSWTRKPWMVFMPYWNWEQLIICRELGTILLLVALVVTLAIALRALNPDTAVGVCDARAAFALSICVVLLTAADYAKLLTRDSFLLLYLDHVIAKALRIVLFYLPVLLFTILLWRKFTGPTLWVCASLSTILLAGLPAFYANRLNAWEYIPIALLAAAGPLWSYYNWRTTPRTHTEGFPVLMKPIPVSAE